MRKLILGLIAAVFAFAPTASPAPAHSAFWNHWGKAGHGAPMFAHARPVGHLEALVINRFGIPVSYVDEGYGTVTNVGVLQLSEDAFWAGPSGAPINTLAVQKFCATGTGTSSAASTDMALQTGDAVAVQTGTITNNTAANSQGEKIVCTMTGYGTEAVTEWGLFNSSTLSATTGTPWTAGSLGPPGTGTVTGTPYTASSTTVAGEEGLVFEDTTKSPAIYLLCTSNTSSVITGPAWYNVTNGNAAAAAPASSDVLKIVPVIFDHQVFSAINTVSGDSIQFTFTLSLPSGS